MHFLPNFPGFREIINWQSEEMNIARYQERFCEDTLRYIHIYMGTLGPTYNASTYPRFCEVSILMDSRNCSEQESQALGSLMPPKKQRQGPKSNHHCRVGHEMMMKIISLVK